MKGDKKVFDKYKDFFLYARSFKDSSPNIAYAISLYAANSINSEVKSKNINMDDNEKTQLKNEILFIQSIGGIKPSIEEFNEFIENIFANVDEEDREGEVSAKTARSFKMVSQLIDVFNFFGQVPPDWEEKKKYSKFKAVDIMTSLKKGEKPRRGGPNDIKKSEDNELESEIRMLERENTIEKKIYDENQKRQGK